jgi:hypothetical protein
MVAVAVGLVVGIGAAFVLIPEKDKGDKGGESSANADKSPTGAASSPSSDASKGGAPAYAEDKIDRNLWDSATNKCNLPYEERPSERFLHSIADPDDPEPKNPATTTFANKVKIGFVDMAASAEDAKEPYYVTISVKPPHDIDPSTGKPVEGLLSDNVNVGFTSKPVDLYRGGGPDKWKYATYPDDFSNWPVGGRKPRPAIPLTNDPGAWTVQFHHVRTPDDYASILCTGFTAAK